MTIRIGFIGLGNQGKPIAGLVAQLMGKLYSLNDETRG